LAAWINHGVLGINDLLAIDPFPYPLRYCKILAHFCVTATILVGRSLLCSASGVNTKRIFLEECVKLTCSYKWRYNDVELAYVTVVCWNLSRINRHQTNFAYQNGGCDAQVSRNFAIV